ncbi:hypothetical protein KY284_004792 [Solanum tuberosum]|nr:hypothetical protein KY284_004792 [Solanum tuberosum]
MGGLPIENTSTTISLSKLPKDQKSAASTMPDSKPKKKICCACPETKKLRDECIVEHGESTCEKWIEAHRKCLRAEGFKIDQSRLVQVIAHSQAILEINQSHHVQVIAPSQARLEVVLMIVYNGPTFNLLSTHPSSATYLTAYCKSGLKFVLVLEFL